MNLSIIFQLEDAMGIPLMTPDMQIIVYLYVYGAVPSQSLQMSLRISPSGFYNVLRRLKQRGLIEGQQSAQDMRMTFYDLAAPTRKLLEERLAPPAQHLEGLLDDNGLRQAAVRYRSGNLPWRHDFRVSHP